jgi:hypothetical protein
MQCVDILHWDSTYHSNAIPGLREHTILLAFDLKAFLTFRRGIQSETLEARVVDLVLIDTGTRGSGSVGDLVRFSTRHSLE